MKEQTQALNEIPSLEQQIRLALQDPAGMEKLYRENKSAFKREFKTLYPTLGQSTLVQAWHERLNYESEELSWGSRRELLFVIVAIIIAALIAKIPEFASLNPDYFYPRNIAFIVFPLLTAYFAWKQQVPSNKIIIAGIIFLASAVYINILPNNPNSDTLLLACIHLPLFLWSVLGFTFVGRQFSHAGRRLEFLRYNGDLVVMTTLMLIAGGILTGITLGLFELIEIRIEDFYFRYIVISGLAAAPIVGTYLVRSNPQLVSKVSPVIARVFTPLVLITLVIYLGAVIVSGKDPYNDREFLLIFNLLLIGVMAIIIFSVAGLPRDRENKTTTALLLALSIITVIVNGIALSAIVFRISEWGITPNRITVLGGNILILCNLLIVAYKLFVALRTRDQIAQVEKSIASYLPLYGLWAIIVCFLFPIVFGFR